MAESMAYDIVIVGAGPAGLSAAIRLKQLSQQFNFNVSVCIVEKGSQVGSHIISGAVFDPRALNELIPNWQSMGVPVTVEVKEEKFLFLSEKNSFCVPHWLLPSQLHNAGNYIISLSQLCRWLGDYAQSLGVEIYPGFPASEILYHEDGSVKGVLVGEMGLDKKYQPKANYTPGMELHGKYTFFAEGCRGSLSEQVMKQFDLRNQSDPQSYGIGIKEIWEVQADQHQEGLIMHTAGWPLDQKTYGGSFIYHMDNFKVAVGFVVGLDYENPYLDPFLEMQRFKTHPKLNALFTGAKRISYGARALNEGGLQALPKLTCHGGVLIGCAAGFLNVPKIKGSHAAIKSGMLAADAAFQALQKGCSGHDELSDYEIQFRKSWLYDELYRARNFRQYFHGGLWAGTLLGGLDLKLFQGKAPWTLHNKVEDRKRLKKVTQAHVIDYPAPDNQLMFDRMSSVYLSNTFHEENQPVHLVLRDPSIPILLNLPLYGAPEQRYCPAGVYEIARNEKGDPHLQINAQNCVHCKTCDIKDPSANITWKVPEGSGGPNYIDM